jgi:hypothetical protein
LNNAFADYYKPDTATGEMVDIVHLLQDLAEAVLGPATGWPNCTRQRGLSLSMFLTMQAVMRWMSGISLPQNFMASSKQACCCSAIPAALSEPSGTKATRAETLALTK